MEILKESCSYLNPFYIDTRYPVHWPTRYDKSIAIEAKKHAERIARWVKDFVKL